MSRERPTIDSLQIRRACPVDLPAFAPHEHARHCAHCDKTVHNLSAGSREEAEDLLARKGAECVYYIRREGRVLFDLARVATIGGVGLFAGCFRATDEGPGSLIQTALIEEAGERTPFAPDARVPPGTVEVTVIGVYGNPMPRARVSLRNVAVGETREEATDLSGRVIFDQLPLGDWELHVAVGDIRGSAKIWLDAGMGRAGKIRLRDEGIYFGGI